MLETLTGQRRYSNGGSLSRGDWKLLVLIFGVLLLAWGLHDVLGFALPSSHVIDFTEHVAGSVAVAWFTLRHGRTRRPE